MGTVLISLLLLAIVAAIIRYMVKLKKAGKSPCGIGCSGDCEHLNRAIILEREAAEKYGYEVVNVVPQPKAGGFFLCLRQEKSVPQKWDALL